jgi:hypothetical protein
VRFPPGQLVAPSGSYRSGGGGNETVEAFETTGHFGDLASGQAATTVNAEQAPKQPDVGADPVAIRPRPSSRETEEITPHDATRSRGPTGELAVACLHTEIRRNMGSSERRVA